MRYMIVYHIRRSSTKAGNLICNSSSNKLQYGSIVCLTIMCSCRLTIGITIVLSHNLTVSDFHSLFAWDGVIIYASNDALYEELTLNYSLTLMNYSIKIPILLEVSSGTCDIYKEDAKTCFNHSISYCSDCYVLFKILQ